jgi:hypothetical protein
LTSPNLPKGLFVTDDFPNDGGNLWAMVRGVPAQAGDFFPTVHFVLGHEDLYDGPVELKILPAPKYTVLNPFEREPWMSAGFGAGEPAFLRARFGEPGDTHYSGQLRSLSGVTSKRVYFEAYVEAVGDDFFASVGVESSRYPEPRGRIGDLDDWGYGFIGTISVPSGGSAKAHAFIPIPYEQYKRLAHPTKVVPGDTIMVALDPKAGNLWFGKNGRWFEGGDPATGLIPTVTGVAIPNNSYHGDFRATVGGRHGTRITMNFGDQKWKYPAPAGFGGIPR